jgi:hypothetical protein
MQGSPREVALSLSQLEPEQARRWFSELVTEAFARRRDSLVAREQFRVGLDFHAELATHLRLLGVPGFERGDVTAMLT